MHGWDHMMGYGLYGGVIMWIILIAIAVVVIYFVFKQSKQSPNWMGPAKESPMDILKRRYAAGEISKEEFERLKKDIEN
jgi:putative membrane protein